MPQAAERDMYPPVRVWLERFLVDRHPGWDVRVLDGSRTSLARLVEREGLAEGLAPVSYTHLTLPTTPYV